MAKLMKTVELHYPMVQFYDREKSWNSWVSLKGDFCGIVGRSRKQDRTMMMTLSRKLSMNMMRHWNGL